MKKFIVTLLVVISLTACTNYGKKVKVEGTKGEVFYKGDGVTEDDAKKTGDFLKEQGFFSADKGASIQVTKEGEEYTMRFVYEKSVYDTLKKADDLFKQIGAMASKEVFGGKKVNIALANKSFKDYKKIPYDEAVAKSLETPTTTDGETVLSKEDFDHDTAGGVDFYWNGISDEESKTIADYIVQNGSFSGGTAELYMTKAGDRYLIRFPVVESAQTDATVISKLAEVSKQIKDNVFPDAPFSFYMTDVKNITIKAWDY